MNLCNYTTGNVIRTATATEYRASLEAARVDGGAGVIEVDGESCYVEGDVDQLQRCADALAVGHVDAAEREGWTAQPSDARDFDGYALLASLAEYGLPESMVDELRAELARSIALMVDG